MPRQARTVDGAVILRVGIGAIFVLGALVLIAWMLGLEPAGSGPAPAVPDSGRVVSLGELTDPITESSGVAVSRSHPGVLWTHNDQAGEPWLYAIRHDGTIEGRVQVVGAEAVDWEDLALGDCPSVVEGDACLYIGDVGDNGAVRDHVTVWIVPEPEPGAEATEPAVRLDFRYPEGPADAEGLALGPDGELRVVTKGDAQGQARLYRIAIPEAPTDAVEVTLVGALPLSASTRETRLTGAAQSPDGSVLAVRTFQAVYLFAMDDPLSSPTVCQVGDLQPQGEAVSFLDAETLVLTSEAPGGSAPILRVRCP